MSSIADRLVFLRGSATQAEFADRVGINVNTLRGYEKGRALPGYEVLESLCSKLNVSPSWILTGQGNVLQEAPFSGLNETPRPLPQPELAEPMPSCDVDLIMIPMVEARLSAGHGSLEVGGDSERSYAFRSDFLHRKGNPREMVLMRVSGDSMEPEIMDNVPGWLHSQAPSQPYSNLPAHLTQSGNNAYHKRASATGAPCPEHDC